MVRSAWPCGPEHSTSVGRRPKKSGRGPRAPRRGPAEKSCPRAYPNAGRARDARERVSLAVRGHAMAAALRSCPGCSRHVRVSEPACPFCGGELGDASARRRAHAFRRYAASVAPLWSRSVRVRELTGAGALETTQVAAPQTVAGAQAKRARRACVGPSALRLRISLATSHRPARPAHAYTLPESGQIESMGRPPVWYGCKGPPMSTLGLS
jgi:hypothetical protein